MCELYGSCHGECVVYAFGQKQLMQINNSVMECRRAGGKVQFPHSCKFDAFFLDDLLAVCVKVGSPTEQRAVIVPAQTFHIEGVEIKVGQNIDDFQ